MKTKILCLLVLSVLLAILPAAGQASPQPEGLEERILVKFRPQVPAFQAQALLGAERLTVTGEISPLGIVQITVPKEGVMEQLWRLQADPRVEYAELDYPLEAFDEPNDPFYKDQWALPKIQAPNAWNITTGSGEVVIAILDTGVDLSHPDLNKKIVPGYDFVNDDNDPQDDHGHGTYVAGIAAAETNNGEGVAGVSWEAKIMPLKVLDSAGWGSHSRLIDGIVWATDYGAGVISMSLGGQDFSQALGDAVNYAHGRGVLLVAAAGNSGSKELMYPAAYSNVVAVSATDRDDQRALFSNYGEWVSVGAPGVEITGLWRREIAAKSGTSAACPHVAGLAALVWSVNPTLTNSEVRWIIEQTAEDLGESGFDEEYGWGRINAFRAVNSANNSQVGGVVTDGTTGLPIKGAEVKAWSPAGELVVVTGLEGQYLLRLVPDTYKITVSHFGYEDQAQEVEVAVDEIREINFELQPRPAGLLRGQVTEAGTDEPLEGIEIRVLGTPETAATDLEGNYSLTLPLGTYGVEVWPGAGHKFAQTEITVPARCDFSLQSILRVLLVNGEAWHSPSRDIGREYEKALKELGYSFDSLKITELVPDAEQLSRYDSVVWVMCESTPADIGADTALMAYLDGGGNLLLFGKDLAYSDYFYFGPSKLMREYLSVSYVFQSPQQPQGEYTGEMEGKGLFEGLKLTTSEEVFPKPAALIGEGAVSWKVISYSGTPYPETKYFPTAAAVASAKGSFRALTCIFDLWEVEPVGARTELLERALGWFALPRLELTVDKLSGANPSEILNYTVALNNPTNAGSERLRLGVPIPEGTSYVGGSGLPELAWHAAENQVVWSGGVIPRGGSVALSFAVRVESDAALGVITTATLSGRGPAEVKASALTMLATGEVPEGAGDYTWADSDQESGPTFKWLDLPRVGGVEYVYLEHNQSLGPIPLFEFPFFGETFSKVWIAEDGFLEFRKGEENVQVFSAHLAQLPLHSSQGVVAHWQGDDGVFIVSWIGVPPDFSKGGSYTFQVILREDGTIIFQYDEMTGPPTGPLDQARVGIQVGIQREEERVVIASPGQVYVHDGLAVRVLLRRYDVFLPFVVAK